MKLGPALKKHAIPITLGVAMLPVNDRITYFRDHPPGVEWEGVFTFKTK